MMASLKRNRKVATRDAIPGLSLSAASRPRRSQTKLAVASKPPAIRDTPNLSEKRIAVAAPKAALMSKLPATSRGKLLSSFILIGPVIA